MIHETYDAITGEGRYQANITGYDDGTTDLNIFYVDMYGQRHKDFSNIYRSVRSARNRLKTYFKKYPNAFVKRDDSITTSDN